MSILSYKYKAHKLVNTLFYLIIFAIGFIMGSGVKDTKISNILSNILMIDNVSAYTIDTQGDMKFDEDFIYNMFIRKYPTLDFNNPYVFCFKQTDTSDKAVWNCNYFIKEQIQYISSVSDTTVVFPSGVNDNVKVYRASYYFKTGSYTYHPTISGGIFNYKSIGVSSFNNFLEYNPNITIDYSSNNKLDFSAYEYLYKVSYYDVNTLLDSLYYTYDDYFENDNNADTIYFHHQESNSNRIVINRNYSKTTKTIDANSKKLIRFEISGFNNLDHIELNSIFYNDNMSNTFNIIQSYYQNGILYALIENTTDDKITYNNIGFEISFFPFGIYDSLGLGVVIGVDDIDSSINTIKEAIDSITSVNDSMNNIDNSLNDLSDNITNDNIDSANSNANGFFNNFESNDFGLSDIITIPLNLIKSITSSNCNVLILDIPYVNKTLTLPCLTSIYEQYFGSLLSLYQTISFGVISYWVCVQVFAMVKGFKNPDSDEIEVIDL